MVRSKASERDKRKTYYEEHPKAPPRIFQREQRTKRISAPCCIPLSLAGFARGKTPCVLCLFFTIITEALWQGTTLYRPPNTTTTKYLINKKKTRRNYNYSMTRISSNIGQRQSKAAISLKLRFIRFGIPARQRHGRVEQKKAARRKTAQLQERNEKRYTPYKRKLYRLGFLGNVYIRKPQTSEIATRRAKEMSKFIRRLKYYAEKHDFPPLKYIYVTEFENDEEKGKHRVHHHVVTNFPDRDVMEDLWRNGGRNNTRRLVADDSGYEGLARYIMKDPKGAKRYVASKNLKNRKSRLPIANSLAARSIAFIEKRQTVKPSLKTFTRAIK